jgi:DNA-binding response OmpR family regulator
MQHRHQGPPTLAVEQADAQKRLLLLDDEEAILLPLARYFAELGYDVVTSREPEEAEALLENDRFDLVMLDLALTRFGREGLEVLASIRATHPWMPVIIFSANVCPEIDDEARRMGADAVLGKPQPLDELERVVARLVGRTE